MRKLKKIITAAALAAAMLAGAPQHRCRLPLHLRPPGPLHCPRSSAGDVR